jgi:hypothetical protein
MKVYVVFNDNFHCEQLKICVAFLAQPTKNKFGHVQNSNMGDRPKNQNGSRSYTREIYVKW